MSSFRIKKLPKGEIKPISMKANNLARAIYKFSLVEKRVMEALISAFEDNADNTTIELCAEDYANLYDCNLKNAYRDLDEASRSLVRKIITIQDDKSIVDEIPLLSRRTYMKGKGILSTRFNDEIIPYLAGLRSHMTLLDLTGTGKFTSFYTWRIYELLCSWKSYECFEVGVDDLRTWCAIPAGYKYSMIKNGVIKKALCEINQNTQIRAAFSELKKKSGKSITHLSFLVESKEEDSSSTINAPALPSIKSRLLNRFLAEGFSNEDFNELLKIRKLSRLPTTQDIIDELSAEIIKAAITYAKSHREIITLIGTKGWRSFKADWLSQDAKPQALPRAYPASLPDNNQASTKPLYPLWEDIKKKNGY